ALMLRYFNMVSIHEIPTVWNVFAIIAILSMLSGNILALLQNNVKRILAYSSISHLGYLLVAFLASGTLSQQAVAFYLVAYFATTLSAFGVITLLSNPEEETEELHQYTALFWRRPWLAMIFVVALISLAGIPPSIGLVGKIFLAAAGVESSLWLLLIVLVVASVIGVYYYMRVVITMFRRPEEMELPEFSLAAGPIANLEGVVLTVLAVLVVGLGLYPVPVFAIIERLIAGI
ncbi:MAG TPA: proton-conducting transporter membrane subunit, partial [Anaerolineales bacterium]